MAQRDILGAGGGRVGARRRRTRRLRLLGRSSTLNACSQTW